MRHDVAMARTVKRIGVATLVVLGVAATAYGFWAYINHDRVDFIDSDEVVAGAERACTEMRLALAQIPVDAPPSERQTAENDAVLAMVASIRNVGESALRGDEPSLEWLDDWERLVAARAAGTAVPKNDGLAITERMNDLAVDSGLDQCQVPPELSRT